MTTVLKTDHIEISEGLHKGNIYYVVWFYSQPGKLFGYNKVFDLSIALDQAIRFLKEVLPDAGDSSTAETACRDS